MTEKKVTFDYGSTQKHSDPLYEFWQEHCRWRQRIPTWVCLMSSLYPSWQRVSTAAQITSSDKVKVFRRDIKSPASTDIMNPTSTKYLYHMKESSLTNYPSLCVFIQMCSNVSHHTQDMAAGCHSYIFWTNIKRLFTQIMGDGRTKLTMQTKGASQTPEHVVPGLQDLVKSYLRRWWNNQREQQPGPCGVLSLGVRNQVGEKSWCKPVLLGPDGDGPAEISTEKKNVV